MKTRHLLIAVGTVVGLAVIYNFYQRRRKDVPVFIRKKLAGGYNARTIPPFGIYVNESEKDNQALLNHEKIHWKQYQDNGLVNYYARYVSEMKQFGYDNMPMEKEARVNESEYCKDNYTECVRNGLSDTVENPAFRT